jgi:hypothetical protein
MCVKRHTTARLMIHAPAPIYSRATGTGRQPNRFAARPPFIESVCVEEENARRWQPGSRREIHKTSKIEEVREELAVAREKLAEAISERARENVLMPLRNRVGELLEQIERLYSAERFRR